MTVDKDRLYKKLEHIGEFAVRENLANGVYGEHRRPLVEEWLEQFDEIIESEAVEQIDDPDNGAQVPAGATDNVHSSESQLQCSDPPWHRRPQGVALLAAILIAIIGGAIYIFA